MGIPPLVPSYCEREKNYDVIVYWTYKNNFGCGKSQASHCPNI